MKTCLLVISDRPRLLERTLLSAARHLPAFHHLVHVDDQAHQLGFAGAIREGWQRALETDADYIFHLEGDFTFNQRVPVAAMLSVLAEHEHLTQLALLRQPWNPQEHAAGGIWQQHPAAYQQRENVNGAWLEHRLFWTTNPSVYPRWVAERGWPDQPQSEGLFGLDLFAEDPARRSAFWGRGEEWCTHIGDQREGHGY